MLKLFWAPFYLYYITMKLIDKYNSNLIVTKIIDSDKFKKRFNHQFGMDLSKTGNGWCFCLSPTEINKGLIYYDFSKIEKQYWYDFMLKWAREADQAFTRFFIDESILDLIDIKIKYINETGYFMFEITPRHIMLNRIIFGTGMAILFAGIGLIINAILK